jgi:hypothetical protein
VSQGLSLRPVRKDKTGESPRTPSVVSRTIEPKLVGRESKDRLQELPSRAPFRLLSIRAPRQAVLRTSSRLAPSITNRPCDLSAKKTRDASNRRLPPNRTACTRTSLVPGSDRRFRGGDTPRSLGLRTASGGLDVSRRPRPLRRIVLQCWTQSSKFEGVSAGVFFPRH